MENNERTNKTVSIQFSVNIKPVTLWLKFWTFIANNPIVTPIARVLIRTPKRWIRFWKKARVPIGERIVRRFYPIILKIALGMIRVKVVQEET